MRFSHVATTVLWIVPLALQCVIAVAIGLRGLFRRFPVFLGYTLLLPARDFLLLFLPYASPLYSRVFWWGEAWAILLALGVIVETVWHLIKPYRFLQVVFRIFWLVVVIAAAAALAIWLRTDRPSGGQIIESIILLERSARFMQVCLLITVIFLISRLGSTWQSYSVGITAGFGVYAALDLTLLELRANLHVISDNAFVLLRSAAYNLAVLIWGFYFLRRREAQLLQRLPSTDLDNWNDELSERIDQWYQP